MTTVPAEPPLCVGPGDARAPGRLVAGDLAAVGLPAVLALILCAYGISSRSLGFDEAATVAIASQHGSALAGAIAHDGGNMSAYYLLLHGLIAVFGHGLLVLRAPAALAAGATVALTSLLGLRLFDRRVGAIAGVLTAISLPLVFWGQSARGYAPMVALVAGSFVAFVELTGPEPRAAARTRAAWLAYLLCTTLAVYAGFVAMLIVPAQLLSLASVRRGVRRVGSALAVAAVCWVPLIVIGATRGSGQLFWVPRPSLSTEKQVLELITSAGLEPSFHRTAVTLVLLAATVALLAFAATRRPLLFARRLLLAWLSVPLLLAWLESLIGQPIFVARNLLPVLPAVGLLLALAITDPRLPRLGAWAVLASLLFLRALPLAGGYNVSPEDWKATTADVLRRSSPRDCVAFYPSDARNAFAYYVRPGGHAPRSVLPRAPWGPSRPYVEAYASIPAAGVSSLPRTCPRLWLVSSHEGQPDGPASSRANLARFHTLRASLVAQYVGRHTTTFGYAATITVELLTGPRKGGPPRSRS
jgi:mannosyltransferase